MVTIRNSNATNLRENGAFYDKKYDGEKCLEFGTDGEISFSEIAV